jgi:hypothetical protein
MSTIKPEAALYKRLKENLPNSHITRLESRVGLGVPDCLVALGPSTTPLCHGGVEGGQAGP